MRVVGKCVVLSRYGRWLLANQTRDDSMPNSSDNDETQLLEQMIEFSKMGESEILEYIGRTTTTTFYADETPEHFISKARRWISDREAEIRRCVCENNDLRNAWEKMDRIPPEIIVPALSLVTRYPAELIGLGAYILKVGVGSWCNWPRGGTT